MVEKMVRRKMFTEIIALCLNGIRFTRAFRGLPEPLAAGRVASIRNATHKLFWLGFLFMTILIWWELTVSDADFITTEPACSYPKFRGGASLSDCDSLPCTKLRHI